MALTVVLENKLDHATGAISTFVFTLSGNGETTADLSGYLSGYKVIGCSFGGSAAGMYAALGCTSGVWSKTVTTSDPSSGYISFTVHALRRGGA
jgi:hypothetical protein